jgi:hypothetical protein
LREKRKTLLQFFGGKVKKRVAANHQIISTPESAPIKGSDGTQADPPTLSVAFHDIVTGIDPGVMDTRSQGAQMGKPVPLPAPNIQNGSHPAFQIILGNGESQYRLASDRSG